MNLNISKVSKNLSKISLTSIVCVLTGSSAFAQTSFTLDQASSITNGLKICDSTDTYCIDIVADLTNPGARLPNTSTADLVNFLTVRTYLRSIRNWIIR